MSLADMTRNERKLCEAIFGRTEESDGLDYEDGKWAAKHDVSVGLRPAEFGSKPNPKLALSTAYQQGYIDGLSELED